MNLRRITLPVALTAIAVTLTAGAPHTTRAAHAADMDWVNHLVFTRYAAGYPSNYRPVDQAVAVRTMIAHHQDAIDGSTQYLQHGTDSIIRAFAERVIRVQTDQIGQMNAWLNANGGDDATPAWAPVFCTIENWGTDSGYLTTMIGHHQAAIDMYRAYALNGSVTDPEMGILMRGIGKGQTGEIAWMEQQLGADRITPDPAG